MWLRMNANLSNALPTWDLGSVSEIRLGLLLRGGGRGHLWFPSESTETQRGQVTYPRPHS